jgi:sterol desaturase/sphingolipid hydroxylase (fatty acid hydroxylase superfamily)
VLQDHLLEIAIAATIWLFSLVIPFRRVDVRPDLLWDLFAVCCAFLFALIVDEALVMPMDWLYAGMSAWHEMISEWSVWALLLSYLIAADLGLYWAHRILHTRPLWPTHAFHHSPEHLNVLAGLRASPVHILLLFLPLVIAYSLFPFPDGGSIALFVFLVEVANQHYIHSNVYFPMARHVEKLFVTPRMHFVHHSARKDYSNSNYGFVFSIWDKMFGTFTDPDSVAKDDKLGLDYNDSKWRMLIGLPRSEAPN